MRCSDCVHYEVCAYRAIQFKSVGVEVDWDEENSADICFMSRSKSRFVELPCEVGQTVYQVLGYSIHEYKITQIRFDDLMMWFYCENEKYVVECQKFLFDITRLGKTVFLSREEAEKALKERSK